MFNPRMLSIIKRELREKLFSRAFILMTLLIPVFMFGILALQTFLITVANDDKSNMVIVSPSEEIGAKVKGEMESLEFVKNGHYQFTYQTMKREDFKKYLADNNSSLLNEKMTGMIFIPDSALQNKKVEYYSKSPNNTTAFEKLRDPINKALVDLYFKAMNLSKDDVKYASLRVDFNGYRVSKNAKIEEEGYGNLIVSFVISFLLYFSLLFTGQMMMRSVVQEKQNRIVEVLLSSVNSSDLMTGKILGTAITGLAQMTIWLSPVIVLVSSSIFILPPEFVLKLNLWQIGYYLLNFVIGLVTFMGLFASLGAIFDNDQDAQSGIWPVMMLIMIPFFIAISAVNNAGSTMAKVSSIVPFSSIIVMPVRMTLVDVPAYEVLASFVINVLTMVGAFKLSGKIYRVGILMTGKKPKWSEVAQWVRYKY